MSGSPYHKFKCVFDKIQGVIVCTDTTVKSLMLKYIELVQTLERSPYLAVPTKPNMSAPSSTASSLSPGSACSTPTRPKESKHVLEEKINLQSRIQEVRE